MCDRDGSDHLKAEGGDSFVFVAMRVVLGHCPRDQVPDFTDHPDRLTKLVMVDICPTHYTYKTADREFASAYFRWFYSDTAKNKGAAKELLLNAICWLRMQS
jgi:hypothetical protein